MREENWSNWKLGVTTGNNAPQDWPRFECKCHYLQIIEGAMYVCTTSAIDSGSYELYANVVKDFGDVEQTRRNYGILING